MSKILFITPMWHEDATPQDAKVCNYFVDDWQKQGHEVVIAHYRSAFPSIYYKVASLFPSLEKRICGDNSDMNSIGKESNSTYHGSIVFSLPIFKYIPHGAFSKGTLEKETRSLSMKLQSIEFSPDIIVGHFCNPTLGIINRLKKYFTNSKTAVVLHEGSGTIARIFKDQAESELNAVDAIGFRSVAIKEDIASHYNLRNHQFMCYSGVATSFVDRVYKEKIWSDSKIRSFLFVGRMSMYKHPQAIPQALNNLYPNKDFSLVYIGKQEAAYKPTSDYCIQSDIADKVQFLGQIDREQIINWYDNTECFVMISDHEVFGLVYLEAMARGCITIAGDNGGMVGIIEHGVNGFLCKPGDVKALTAIIERMNNMSAEDRASMSQKARETALIYSDNKVAQYYLENITSLENIDYHKMQEKKSTPAPGETGGGNSLKNNILRKIEYYYSKFFKKIIRGKCIINSTIHPTSHVDSATEFYKSEMDKYSYVGYDSQVFNTKIGSFCSIGDFFLCGGASHPSDWVSTSSAFYGVKNNGNKIHFASFDIPDQPPTIIGHDVWCGLRVTIMAGVKIGTGAIIGAGSVVTHDVPPYAIVAGVPAKIIRFRFEGNIINQLLESKWWELPDEQIKNVAPYIRKPEVFLKVLQELKKSTNGSI